MEAYAPTPTHYTFEEYLQLEVDTGCRYEYYAGQVYAMSGGAVEHAIIGGNVFALLRAALRKQKKNCKALNNDAKVYIATRDIYVYPDAMAICGAMQKSDQEANAVTNPTMIVEVLSKSTADYDRGDKFYKYRQLPSLQEYVLIEQGKAVVETFSKQPDADLWRITRVEGVAASVEFRSLGISLSLADIYEDVEFPESGPPESGLPV